MSLCAKLMFHSISETDHFVFIFCICISYFVFVFCILYTDSPHISLSQSTSLCAELMCFHSPVVPPPEVLYNLMVMMVMMVRMMVMIKMIEFVMEMMMMLRF